jgi:signal transduction histidine kinase
VRLRYVALLCLFLAVLLSLQAFIYREVKSRTIQAGIELETAFARSTAIGIENYVCHLQDDLAAVANDVAAAGTTSQEVKDALRRLHDMHPQDIGNATRVSAEGILTYTYPENPRAIGADISYQKHVKEVLRSHAPVVSEPFMAVQGYKAIALHYPVFDASGLSAGKAGKKFLGSVAVILRFDRLAELFMQPLADEGDRLVMLVNSEGIILSSARIEDIGKSFFDVVTGHKIVPDILTAIQSAKPGYSSYQSEDSRGNVETFYAVYQPMQLANQTWMVIVGRSEQQLTSIMKQFTRNFYLSTGVLVLIALLVFLEFSHKSHEIILSREKARLVEELERTVKDRTEEMRRLNENLENMVEQRTAKLSEMQVFLRSIVDNLVERLVVVDPDLRIVEVNRRFLEEEGVVREDVLGKPCFKLDCCALECGEGPRPAGTGRDDCLAQSVLKTKRQIVRELPHKLTDGTTRYYEVVVTPVEAQKGEVHRIILSRRDITERKQMEQRMIQAQKMETIGTFAGSIAHDFNNFLTKILGYAGFVKMMVSPTEEIYKYLETIEQSSKRAAELTQRLLNYSRPAPVHRETLDVNHVVETTLELLSKSMPENITLRTEVSEKPLLVKGDRGQLEQVLTNLSFNSRDAMPSGGTITIATKNVVLTEEEARRFSPAAGGAGEYLCLSVADTGAGIPKEIQDHIFEPFFTTKQVGMGTGLGLAIAYQIVKNHGGTIQFESEPGKGTIFRVFLPVAREEGVVAAEQPPPPE